MHGPADNDGIITVNAEGLREQADMSRNMFLMDYGSIGADWAGEISISVIAHGDIVTVLAAVDTFGVDHYPAGWREALVADEASLKPHRAAIPR
jgi:hypothetical protein